MITKFNYKFLTQLKGAAFVSDLKDAVAVYETWGYEFLQGQRPALFAIFKEAKKLPRTQKEWTEKNTKFFTWEEVRTSEEIPEDVREKALQVMEYTTDKVVVSAQGIFRMPHLRDQNAIGWWVKEDGKNGQWFRSNGEVCKVCKENGPGFYESSIRTYSQRIQKGLPLYTHGSY